MSPRILPLILAAAGVPAAAAMHSVTESANYTLSDTDSRNDGRQKCVDSAKRIALDKAGSVFEAEMTASRQEMGTDQAQIKMRSTFAAVVSSKIVSEQMDLWGDRAIVHCAVEVTYDPEVVTQKMHDLADAEGLRKQVAQQQDTIVALQDQVREAQQAPAVPAPVPGAPASLPVQSAPAYAPPQPAYQPPPQAYLAPTPRTYYAPPPVVSYAAPQSVYPVRYVYAYASPRYVIRRRPVYWDGWGWRQGR